VFPSAVDTGAQPAEARTPRACLRLITSSDVYDVSQGNVQVNFHANEAIRRASPAGAATAWVQ
jgi:hypothetical protein